MIQKGKVYIIGAGPGDPELLTLKALRYLQQADIVLTDRLVSEVIIKEYLNPKTEVLHVGKQCGRGGSTSQGTINELMVLYAEQGKVVARLKGGDVSIFSNVLDELQTLHEHQISYEIVPGITAASGAAAYAGIPLTARNHSTAVRFITHYKDDAVPSGYWNDLASTADTLVFYMSSEMIHDIADNLVKNHIDPKKRMAVIEQATTPFQNVFTCNLYDFCKEPENRKFKSPSIIIIGKVAGLHERFSWVENLPDKPVYFEPVPEKPADNKQLKRA